MKKLIMTVVVIMAALLLVAPKLIGSTVQQERENVLVEINKTDGITLVTNEYTGGWFGADISSSLVVQLEEDGISELTLVLEEEVSFGPILFTNQGWQLGLGYSELKFKLSSVDVDSEIMALINEKIHLGALLGLNNNVTTFINTDEFSYEDQGNEIKSAPSSAKFSFIDNKKINGEFSWGGLELNELGERFVIGKVAMSTEQEVVSGDYFEGTAILSGDANISVEKINLFSQDNHVFSLNYTELTSAVSVEKDLLALNVKYHAKDVSASGQYFEKPSLEVELANVDVNALQELNTTLADLSSNQATPPNSDEILQILSDIAEKILVKNPTLKVTNLSVVAAEGEISTAMNLNLNKDLFDVNNLDSMSFFKALEADATGKAPIGFLAKFGVSPMVDGFVQQGYLTKQDNDISFDAKYIKSQLTLNGKAFQF